MNLTVPCEHCEGTGQVVLHYGPEEGARTDCGKCDATGWVRADKWDVRFMRLAMEVGSWSKDPSTKTGAVLVRPDRTVAALGFNGFPRGMRDDKALYDNRERKYDRVIHCEINAVLSCRDPLPLEGYSLYTLGPSCSRCAVHMIQAGIRRFVYTDDSKDRWEAWGVARTFQYFDEVGATRLELHRV